MTRWVAVLPLLCGGAWSSYSAEPEPEDRPASAMSYAQAAILGIVEGVTEYIPVSSTGHLLVAQRMMGLDGERHREGANAYVIAVQAGAILAALGLYRKRLRWIFAGLAGRGNPAGRRLGLCLLLAFLPSALLALAARGWIMRTLFGMWPIVFAWVAGGVAILLLSGRGRKTAARSISLEDMAIRQAGLIGVAQCLALWPGVSRSLATIAGALLVGLTLPAAVEFSFLLGLFTLSAAAVYAMYYSGGVMLDAYGWPQLLLGLIAAFVFARLSMQWIVRYLQGHSLRIFGWYRIVLGAAVAALVLLNWI